MDVAVEVDLVVDLLGRGGDRPADGDVVPVVELGQALAMTTAMGDKRPRSGIGSVRLVGWDGAPVEAQNRRAETLRGPKLPSSRLGRALAHSFH